MPTTERSTIQADRPAVFDNVKISDITFVVRSAGERTARGALRLIEQQIVQHEGGSTSQIELVNERPFSHAMRRTLELGAERARPWTIGIDADVLLVNQGVERLLGMCRAAKPGSFTVTGLMLCKFYGGFVFRGVHCYRTELLERAATLIGKRTPGGPDPCLKPESAVVHAMEAVGFGYEGHPVVLAAHDYEQSFRHIYLKLRMRGRREAEAMRDGGGKVGAGDPNALAAYCRERAVLGDKDHLVALWGIEDGVADASRPTSERHESYNWFAEWPEYDRRVRDHGLTEKEHFDPRSSTGYADCVIEAHRLDIDTRTPKWIREALAQRTMA